LRSRAALDGVGIACIPEGTAAPFLRTGELIRVLEGSSPSVEGLFIYYHGRRQIPAALRACIDMIRGPKAARVT
jgi:DNA-binding transcriptional LysR family regulator